MTESLDICIYEKGMIFGEKANEQLGKAGMVIVSREQWNMVNGIYLRLNSAINKFNGEGYEGALYTKRMVLDLLEVILK